MKKIFLSHSHADADLAKILAKLIKSATNITLNEIVCTSLPGAELKPGGSLAGELNKHIKEVQFVIGLITHNSQFSDYVTFELGAGWGLNKAIAILDFGVDPSHAPAALRESKLLKMDRKEDLISLIEWIAKSELINIESISALNEAVDNFLADRNVIQLNNFYAFEKIHPVPGRVYQSDDFNKLWPQTMLIRDSFCSVSRMSPSLWNKNESAVVGIFTLGGVKHFKEKANIRRVFIIDDKAELDALKNILDLHLKMCISIGYMTIQEYTELCKDSPNIIADRKGIRDFEIHPIAFTISKLNYQTDFYNDTCIVFYELDGKRRVKSFKTIGGNETRKAEAYEAFFEEIWARATEIT